MRRWPAKEYDLICVEVNAHSLLWDNSVANRRTGKRGVTIEGWLTDNNMLPLNDGSHTHTSRSSGTQSAPDVTLAHVSMMDKMKWEQVDDLGSDHVPIIITYQYHIPTVNNRPTYKWRLKDADWDSYRREVERSIPLHYKRKNINKVEKRLRKVNQAANKHIGKKKVTDDNKCYLTTEVKEAIRRRNALRKTVSDNREQWIEACREVLKMVKEEKERRWKEYVGELNRTADAREIFRTVQSATEER